jgi:hypothetical protein
VTETGFDPPSLPDPLRGALQAYQDEYRDLSDTWRHLDGKAQGSLATAGVFLAATFAFAKSLAEHQIPTGSRPTLIAGIFLLVMSVVLAVLSLRIRTVTAAPFGDRLEKLTNDLMRIDDVEERNARAPDYIREQIAMWRDVNEEMHGQSDWKARLVLASQVVLLLAILGVAGLTIALVGGWV